MESTPMRNIPLVKEYKDDDISVLIISYRFKDKTINGTGLGPKIKEYYEKNSRFKIRLNFTYFTAIFNTNFGYTAQNVQTASNQARVKYGKNKFKFYIHVCNPARSTSGTNTVKTFNSATNAIHEFGHLLKFGHSNKMDYSGKKPKVLYSRDPFDAVILYVNYPSLSPPHLYSHGWYNPGELVFTQNERKFRLYMLRDFSISNVVKTLGFYKNNCLYFISYGWKPVKKTKKPEYFLIVHYTNSEFNYSFLETCYSFNKVKESEINHNRTGFKFRILDRTDKYLDLQVFGNGDQTVYGNPIVPTFESVDINESEDEMAHAELHSEPETETESEGDEDESEFEEIDKSEKA